MRVSVYRFSTAFVARRRTITVDYYNTVTRRPRRSRPRTRFYALQLRHYYRYYYYYYRCIIEMVICNTPKPTRVQHLHGPIIASVRSPPAHVLRPCTYRVVVKTRPHGHRGWLKAVGKQSGTW